MYLPVSEVKVGLTKLLKNMQQLFQDFKIETKKTIVSKRAEVVSLFVDEINNERAINKWGYYKGEKWVKLKPITGRAVAIHLSPIKNIEELWDFLSECRTYKQRNGSFAKRYFGKYEKK